MIIEPLETRIAPAAVFTYVDAGGDLATIKTSKGTDAQLEAILTFETAWGGKQLRLIDFSANPVFVGTTLSVIAKPGPTGGDGFVDVGRINAKNAAGDIPLNLGMISIEGDLGQIESGSSVEGLSVRSMHHTYAPNHISTIAGSLGLLKVTDDFVYSLYVDGFLGSVKIGGTYVGVAGLISAAGGMGDVKIAGSLEGAIVSSGSVGSVKIGGSILDGRIEIAGKLGRLDVGNYVVRSRIEAQGDVGSVTIARSVEDSQVTTGGLGRLKVGGAISNTSIHSFTEIESLTVAGPVSGSDFTAVVAGSIEIGGPISTSDFSVDSLGSFHVGGYFSESTLTAEGAIRSVRVDGTIFGGHITAGTLGSVLVRGSIVGGSEAFSGRIFSEGAMGQVKVNGYLEGGAGLESGQIHSNGNIASVFIGRSVIGSGNAGAGRIFSTGNIGRIEVAGDVYGGSGFESGQILSEGGISSLKIRGSLFGGTNDYAGSIISNGGIGTVRIEGDIKGGSIDSASNRLASGFLRADRIGNLFVGGSIIAGVEANGGTLSDCGSVRVAWDIGAITIKGGLIGNAANPVLITAQGQMAPEGKNDVAIRSVKVAGNVEFTEILAGYSASEGTVVGKNADAQIGSVFVRGNWIASSLVAGIQDDDDPAHDDSFGIYDKPITGGIDTAERISRIARVLIKGDAFGTAGGNDSYALIAQEIGSLIANGYTIVRSSDPFVHFAFDPTSDLFVEVLN